MKRLSLFASLVLAFAMTAWAQTPSSNDTQSGTGSSASQGSQSSTSGSMGSQSGSMGSQGSMSTSGTAGQTSGSHAADMGSGHEKKLKGCLESQNGAYAIREKNGKEVAVTGSADMSQYVNHEVVAHGTWSSGASDSSAVSSNPSDMSKGSKSGKEFTATKIESVSDTCKGGKSASKGANSSSPTSPQ